MKPSVRIYMILMVAAALLASKQLASQEHQVKKDTLRAYFSSEVDIPEGIPFLFYSQSGVDTMSFYLDRSDSVAFLYSRNDTMFFSYVARETVKAHDPVTDSLFPITSQNKELPVYFTSRRSPGQGRIMKIESLLTPEMYRAFDTIKLWNVGGSTSLDIAETMLKHWKKGESQLDVTASVELFADYSFQDTRWDNDFDLKEGLLYLGDLDRITMNDMRKNTDMFELSTQYGKNAFNDWFYSSMISFKSQVFRGYAYPNDSVYVSRFMAPGYFLVSLGLDYKPNEDLSILLSPITSKTTYVLDTSIAIKKQYGFKEEQLGEDVREELGSYMKIKHHWPVPGYNLEINNKLDVFVNYLDQPAFGIQWFDWNWDLEVIAKIGPHLDVKINTYMIYDYDELIQTYKYEDGEKVKDTQEQGLIQLKQMMTFGLVWRFEQRM